MSEVFDNENGNKIEIDKEKAEKILKEAVENSPLLPIGSIVALKNLNKRVMIESRLILDKNSNKYFDYMGCFYPEGRVNNDKVFLFNREDIALVYFIGFQDVEELYFRSSLNEMAKAAKESIKE